MHDLARAAGLPAVVAPSTPPLDLAVAAWVASKAGRTGSERTRRAYADTLASFRAALDGAALTLDAPAPAVALAAQGWAARGAPAPATFNQRLAILSSFYAFARRQGLFAGENPIDRVERRRVQRYAAAKALPLADVRDALAAIDRTTVAGQRDYCLLAVALQTGRRVAELAGLRWGHVAVAGSQITLTWARTKGGKRMADTLPAGLSASLAAYLRAAHGPQLRTLPADGAVWVDARGLPIGIPGVRAICAKHLGTTKVHALRHTFARTLEETGAKLSDIQARLGHANAATTGIYMSALHANENPHADALAALLGLD
jgi:integrase